MKLTQNPYDDDAWAVAEVAWDRGYMAALIDIKLHTCLCDICEQEVSIDRAIEIHSQRSCLPSPK